MIHRLPYRTKFARPFIAVAVAYALVLQVLLLSVTVSGAAMAPLQADQAAICYGSGNTGDNPQPHQSPADFADCTLSCAQGLSATAILPSDISPAPVFAAGRDLERHQAAAFVLSQRPSPKLAQGPPQTV
ncbi:MAG: hypothetical protein ABUL48_06200 [Pseudorhodoplanes sp.]